MARYVLLAFDDEAEAEKFLNSTKLYVADEKTNVSEVFGVVRGVWKKPTKFCECSGKGKSGFTRGRKYGWWVCNNCRRPTESWAKGDHWASALGTNLLPISPDAPEWRGPGHVKHEGYEPKPIWCQNCGRFKFNLEPGTYCDEHPDTQLTLSPMHLAKEN
jgi:hypothetical protein